jgi:hypothetical protein
MGGLVAGYAHLCEEPAVLIIRLFALNPYYLH